MISREPEDRATVLSGRFRVIWPSKPLNTVSPDFSVVGESGTSVSSGGDKRIVTSPLPPLGAAAGIIPVNGEVSRYSLIFSIIPENVSRMPRPPINMDEMKSSAAMEAARIFQSSILLF